MTTPTPSSSSRMLLTLTTAIALLFAAPSVHAQDCDTALVELEAALMEVETIADEVADQRNEALALAEKNRKQRDRCEGAYGELSKAARALRVTVADYERTIAKLEARPKGAFWYGAGFATPIVATLLVATVYFFVVR
jgi:hypothetical protein